jgi:diketogulonate reductase-like aldo/keto reductase
VQNYAVRLVDTAQAAEWYDERQVGHALTAALLSPSNYLSEDHTRIEKVVIVTKIHPRSFALEKMEQKVSESVSLSFLSK